MKERSLMVGNSALVLDLHHLQMIRQASVNPEKMAGGHASQLQA